MRELGEIKRGIDINLKTNSKRIWHKCKECGKERWTLYLVKQNKPKSEICISCSHKDRVPSKETRKKQVHKDMFNHYGQELEKLLKERQKYKDLQRVIALT